MSPALAAPILITMTLLVSGLAKLGSRRATVDAMTSLRLPGRGLHRLVATVLPGGWKLGQITAEQPATTYGEFKKEILNEIARCLNMPFNVAAGNSAGYNYASGRLDHQTYFKTVRVDQAHIESCILDPEGNRVELVG